MTSLKGEQKIRLSSTNSGVAWNFVRAINAGRAALEIAGVKLPGADEIADIVGRDLGERREPRSAGVAAPMLPGGSRSAIEMQKMARRDEQTNRISHPDPASAT